MEMVNPPESVRSEPAAALGPELPQPPARPEALGQAVAGVGSPGMPVMPLGDTANLGLTGIRRQAWLRKGIPELASPLAG